MNLQKIEKLDTRLEMQAVFLPDGAEMNSQLESGDVSACGGNDSCSYDCDRYTCNQ